MYLGLVKITMLKSISCTGEYLSTWLDTLVPAKSRVGAPIGSSGPRVSLAPGLRSVKFGHFDDQLFQFSFYSV